MHFEDTQRIKHASAQNSQPLTSNIISNGICAADTINKIWKVDAVQTISEEFLCANLVTHLIPNTFRRARQGFHSRAHSVQFSILLFSLLKKPQLFYISTPSVREPPRGKDMAFTLRTPPKAHHWGCPLLTDSAVLSFPWGRAEAPHSSQVYAGWHMSVPHPEAISFWGVLLKE